VGRTSHTFRCLWLFVLRQGGSVRPSTPRAGLSSLRPDLMAVALLVFVAHAAVARGQRWWRLRGDVVAINKCRGISSHLRVGPMCPPCHECRVGGNVPMGEAIALPWRRLVLLRCDCFARDGCRIEDSLLVAMGRLGMSTQALDIGSFVFFCRGFSYQPRPKAPQAPSKRAGTSSCTCRRMPVVWHCLYGDMASLSSNCSTVCASLRSVCSVIRNGVSSPFIHIGS
jgi:hypothetical protein